MPTTSSKAYLAISLLLLWIASSATAKIIYVDVDVSGENSGLRWVDAYNYLQDALADANMSEEPAEIRVAHGIYTPDSNSAVPDGTGDRYATFQLINGVTLKGGYAGFGEQDPDARDINVFETILSGDLNGDDSSDGGNSENVLHVVTSHSVDETAVLDGVTVTGGNANGVGPDGRGGGMYNGPNSSPTLTNCTFSDNAAAQAGGVFNIDSSNPKVSNCIFMRNAATMWNAGAMLNWNSSPIVTNCTFRRNSAADDGAGIYNYFEQTAPLIANCIFTGNYAEGDGGGMYNRNSTNVTVVNCMFTGNSSPNGNAVACDSHGGGHRFPNTVKLTNCILWEGGNEVWIGDDSTVDVNFCDVPGGWPGEGNIDLDPLLTPDGHLSADSPCINAGDPAYSPAPAETDIDGESRIYDGRVDMGPDEFIDSDSDGLADWWEQKHFQNATSADPAADPDGDDLDNLAEYRLSRNPTHGARTYYVDPGEGSDEWDGLSAIRDGEHGPKATIQAAIDKALMYEGDTIILAAGRYTGTGNKDINFKGKVITVRSVAPADPAVVAATIIDCEGSEASPHRGFNFHCGEGSNSAVVGLTISNGFHWAGGGGIYCRRASPTISKNIITDNVADGDGGGIYCRRASPMIIGNTIKDNTADDDGGGIYCRYASPTISNNIITGNMVADNGGGIFCRNSSGTITNNLITGNRAEDGGGIWLRDSSLMIANNTLTGNLAQDIGGGIGCRGDLAVPTVTNSILWANTALNGYEIALRQGSTLTVSYSDVQVRPTAFYLEEDCTLNLAANNIDADPLFAEPGYWVDPNNPDTVVEPNDPCALWIDGDDYHLQSQGWRWGLLRNRWAWTWDDVTSQCIDAGNPGCQLGDEPLNIPDYPDQQYGANLRINMGAYGGTTEASMGPHGWALLGDITNDGIVDLKELVLQASNWLARGSEQPNDLNRNGIVDLTDLDLMTRDWLEQTSWYEP